MKAVAYLRVSTEGQCGDDRFGIPTQREAVKEYAQAQGITIISFYEDDGESGASLDRPGLQQLMRDSSEGNFNKVLVYKMDRVARDLYVSLFVEKELLLNGIDIISVTEPFGGQDPMSIAFRQMMACFAELEKNMITSRMSGGRKQKAKGGGYAGGGPAIGYKAKRGTKILELDIDKAITVKRVFFIRRENPGYTLQQIADQLNREGHTTAQGKKFKRIQVKRILDRRELYSGIYSYSDIKAEGQHKAII